IQILKLKTVPIFYFRNNLLCIHILHTYIEYDPRTAQKRSLVVF
ncbi:MAG: hypothetical protein ACI90V_011033, partial [Bacillariaceae sp.]